MTDEPVFGERARRRALNEATFRELNERLRSVNADFAEVTDRFSIVCECDDTACLDQISLGARDYEAIRSDATLFAVRPNHDSPAVESVVEEREGYNVVRKKPGDPAAIAIASDPRTA